MSFHTLNTQRVSHPHTAQGTCACGWSGPVHEDSSNGYPGTRQAETDYIAHVEEAMGPENAYLQLEVACIHCGSRHVQAVPVGVHISSYVCHRCGQRNLRPGNSLWAEAMGDPLNPRPRW